MTEVPPGQEVDARAHPPLESGTRRSRVFPNCTAPLAEADANAIASRIEEIMLRTNALNMEISLIILINLVLGISWDLIPF